MAYVAIKPCRFAGQAFRIGDSIPAELIQPGAAKNLVKMGIITSVSEPAAEQQEEWPKPLKDTTPIILHADEGDLILNVTGTGLQMVFDVLTVSVSKAENIIKDITDGEALILLHATDSRKTIKELAAAQAKEISKESEGGEDEV